MKDLIDLLQRNGQTDLASASRQSRAEVNTSAVAANRHSTFKGARTEPMRHCAHLGSRCEPYILHSKSSALRHRFLSLVSSQNSASDTRQFLVHRSIRLQTIGLVASGKLSAM